MGKTCRSRLGPSPVALAVLVVVLATTVVHGVGKEASNSKTKDTRVANDIEYPPVNGLQAMRRAWQRLKSVTSGRRRHGVKDDMESVNSAVSSGRFIKYPRVPASPQRQSNYDQCTIMKPNYGNYNFRGWQNCPSGTYQTGYFRDGCDRINCIAGINCCKPKNQPPNSGWSCYAQNMWSRFDHRGWHHCDKKGYFLNGWWKNNGNMLYHIENFHCCKPKWSEPKYDSCYTENWWGSLDRRGWSTCRRPNHFIRGIYRNWCHDLHCLEMAYCCAPSYPRPPTDTKQNRGYLSAFPGTQVQRGRAKVSSQTLRTVKAGRYIRMVRGVVTFKQPFYGNPQVHLTTSLVDSDHNRSQKFDIFVERVTPRQFYYRVQAWGDAVIYGLHLEWMAVGRGVKGYVAGQKEYLTVRKLLVTNRALQKVQHNVYVHMIHIYHRMRGLHVWAVRHNHALRKAREGMERELKTNVEQRKKEEREIEIQVRFVQKLRFQIEENMKGLGEMPKDIQHIWNYANSTKLWAAKTLVDLRDKQVSTSEKVRKDMIAVWNQYRPLEFMASDGLAASQSVLGGLGVRIQQSCPNCPSSAELDETLQPSSIKCKCSGTPGDGGKHSCKCVDASGKEVNLKLSPSQLLAQSAQAHRTP